MINREKLLEMADDIKSTIHKKQEQTVFDYKVYSICCQVQAMLKEQEPIEPVDDGHGSLICGNQGFGCGCVGRYDITTKVVEKYCNFCPECGRKVKWG